MQQSCISEHENYTYDLMETACFDIVMPKLLVAFAIFQIVGNKFWLVKSYRQEQHLNDDTDTCMYVKSRNRSLIAEEYDLLLRNRVVQLTTTKQKCNF